MPLRYSFFVRPVIHTSRTAAVNSATEAIVITDDTDLIEPQLHPYLLGWRAFLSDDLPDDLQSAVKRVFSKIRLGCTY